MNPYWFDVRHTDDRELRVPCLFGYTRTSPPEAVATPALYSQLHVDTKEWGIFWSNVPEPWTSVWRIREDG